MKIRDVQLRWKLRQFGLEEEAVREMKSSAQALVRVIAPVIGMGHARRVAEDTVQQAIPYAVAVSHLARDTEEAEAYYQRQRRRLLEGFRRGLAEEKVDARTRRLADRAGAVLLQRMEALMPEAQEETAA